MDSIQTTPIVKEVVLPHFVRKTILPDSLRIELDQVIYGDFNGDEKNDFASIVTSSGSGYEGVLIIHNEDEAKYFVFGAGNNVNGMVNLDWIDVFQIIPKGGAIAPTLVNPETGDIVGPDSARAFNLIGDGIYMHVDEVGGGGILFWTGERYDWYHIE